MDVKDKALKVSAKDLMEIVLMLMKHHHELVDMLYNRLDSLTVSEVNKVNAILNEVTDTLSKFEVNNESEKNDIINNSTIVSEVHGAIGLKLGKDDDKKH